MPGNEQYQRASDARSRNPHTPRQQKVCDAAVEGEQISSTRLITRIVSEDDVRSELAELRD